MMRQGDSTESIFDEYCDPTELKKFERIYSEQLQRGQPSAKAMLDYASCLVRSRSKEDNKHGVALLEDLLSRDNTTKSEKSDYLFYLAVGQCRLTNYNQALEYVDTLLKAEQNQRTINLKKSIECRMRRDGIIGMAIVGGGFLLGGAVLAGVIAFLTTRRR